MTDSLPTVLLFGSKKVMSASGPAAQEIIALVMAHERDVQPEFRIVGPAANLADARSVVMWHPAPEHKDQTVEAYLDALSAVVDANEKRLLDQVSKTRGLKPLAPHIAAHMVFCPSEIPSAVVERRDGTGAPIFCFRLMSPNSLHILSWDTEMVDTASAMYSNLVFHVNSVSDDFVLPEPPDAASSKKHKGTPDKSDGDRQRKKSKVACRR